MEYLTILCFTDKGKSVSLKWSVLFCSPLLPLGADGDAECGHRGL